MHLLEAQMKNQGDDVIVWTKRENQRIRRICDNCPICNQSNIRLPHLGIVKRMGRSRSKLQQRIAIGYTHHPSIPHVGKGLEWLAINHFLHLGLSTTSHNRWINLLVNDLNKKRPLHSKVAKRNPNREWHFDFVPTLCSSCHLGSRRQH
jgi:hypothetical protein